MRNCSTKWPAIQAMLPDLRGRRLVDLGCGFGWFARWARTEGASHVLGLDLSENMLARAKAGAVDPAVEYARADLETLELPAGEFDLAYSSLTFHYIEDFGRLIRMVFRALTPGAHLVFTIEHPIYMASTRPGWLVREDGQKTWAVDNYAVEGARTTDWLARGVVKQHRTLGTTLNTLIASGFAVREVQEWHPTQEQVAERPALAEEMERPMMVLISAQR
ncbi:class I SAM-dependent methyltransferase [Roseomonas sp. E05]|nr:class I SAM-dependent methyltransferase [Roseomonas sp. E05]MDJ0389012.1 class I SAM-dependent methyltransferase [Roseomonas sp. E05]